MINNIVLTNIKQSHFGGIFMKKLMLVILALAMAVGFAGTALAANTVELNFNTSSSGVTRVFWSPVYGTATGGASAFMVGGNISNETTSGINTGTTLMAVSNTLTNTAGTELRAVGIKFVSGATPIGGPALKSGTSDTVYFQVFSPVAVGSVAGTSGNTLYAINGGTGAEYWTKGLASNGFYVGAVNTAVFNSVASGTSAFSLAPITIDTESSSTSGVTLYGVTSGASGVQTNGGTGVSVWAIDGETGAFTTNTLAQSNVTGFTGASGVSTIQAAPVVSGTSVFFIGYSFTTGGNTLFQFDKNNIAKGPVVTATVNAPITPNASKQFIPTPCVTGNSIFVVDANGSVSAFYTANLTRQYGVKYSGNEAVSGVTAGPVTDGDFIVLCSTSSVSCYAMNDLSRAATSSAAKWGYNFGANTTIDATPAISSGYVWVTVNNQVLSTSTTYRFTLNSTTGGIQTVGTYGNLTYASPIVATTNVWTVSYNPTVSKIADAGADGNEYWPQFKYDAAKTGANTAATSIEEDDDDSGCFITTIK